MKSLVIFQNYFSPYRHKLFEEIAKKVQLTVIYLQKPQEEGRKWEEEKFAKDKSYKSVQMTNKSIGPIVWSKYLTRIQKYITPETVVIFLDNLPTNISMLRFIGQVKRMVPRKNLVLWEEHILPAGTDNAVKVFYKKALTIMLALSVDTVISFSEMTTAYLAKLNIPLKGQKIVRTYQTTYTEEEIQGFKGASIPLHEQKSGRTITYGFLGYFTKRKGLAEILKATKIHRNKNARFLFVGDGPMLSALQTAAAVDSRIIIKPYAVSEKEKTDYFSEMDVHLVPSEKDPWCVVVNEAASRGVPSLVSPNVGAQELSKMISPVFLLKEANSISLAKTFLQIENIKKNKKKWIEIREKAYKVAAFWSVEKAAETFIKLAK